MGPLHCRWNISAPVVDMTAGEGSPAAEDRGPAEEDTLGQGSLRNDSVSVREHSGCPPANAFPHFALAITKLKERRLKEEVECTHWQHAQYVRPHESWVKGAKHPMPP